MSYFKTNEETPLSTTDKVKTVASDFTIAASTVIALTGLTMLACELADAGYEKFKSWKKNKKNATTEK